MFRYVALSVERKQHARKVRKGGGGGVVEVVKGYNIAQQTSNQII